MRILAGRKQELPVYDSNEKLYFLGDERRFIPLPKRDVRGSLEEGDMVEVFTFYNENRELEATTKMPDIQVGEVGSFKIAGVNDLGAFVHIGTKRDMLIPKREMREPLEEGRYALIILQEDARNARLFASTRIHHYLKDNPITCERGDEVELTIAEKIEIGRRVIVNGINTGVLFRQEMMRQVREGEKIKGYVRKVEGNEITVSMTKEGMALIEDAKAKIMEFLHGNNGYIRLNDDSDPEEIKLRLRMSKKTFKKAVGVLYKEQKVVLTKFGVKLNRQE
ncbi:MAG: S1-like domain-containing RNA-binding protein [Flavobacteriales bacterium]